MNRIEGEMKITGRLSNAFFSALAGFWLGLTVPGAQAAPTLTVCIDSAAGGFNYGTAVCINDNGSGDLLTVTGAIITASFLTGGLTINSAIGEPMFDPGFGMALSVDGTVNGAWIVAVAQTGLIFGGAPGSPINVSASFTGSTFGPGTASYAVYVDDANRGLDSWGPVGSAVAGGGFGSSSGTVTLSDPFSILAFVTFDAAQGATYYSTDLTMRVPEPGILALLGLGLAGLAVTRRRRQ